MLLATALLSAGWLMKPFPVLMLAALAPLLAISESAKPGIFWEKLEYILVALLFSFWAAHLFDLPFVLPAIGQAIAGTLVLAAVAVSRITLGKGASAFVFVSAWLALEFLLLKAGLGAPTLFLADAFSTLPGWTGWSRHLGYLATTAWILLANVALYKAFWNERRLHFGWLITFLIIAVGPVGYSVIWANPGIARSEMLALYQGNASGVSATYVKNGELLARTCSWVSALIILFAFVKLKTTKR